MDHNWKNIQNIASLSDLNPSAMGKILKNASKIVNTWEYSHWNIGRRVWGQAKVEAENLSQLWFSRSRWVPQLWALWQDDPCRAVNLTRPTAPWLFDPWLFLTSSRPLLLSLSVWLFFCSTFCRFLPPVSFALCKLSEGDKAGQISWLPSKCFPCVCRPAPQRRKYICKWHAHTPGPGMIAS